MNRDISETHPSLKGKGLEVEGFPNSKVYHDWDVRENTIDKAVLKEWVREFFEKFDNYACVKNDKWYQDYRNKKYEELGL